jgi:hypothetical protein
MLTRPLQEKSLTWISILVMVTLINGGLLWWYHDRTWWEPDDGQFAHVAERILHGEVLHRDIQDVRPGYVNFINAAALYLFGPSLLSLRYPVALIALTQSALLFLLFRSHGAMLAGALSLSSVALGVLHYMNPNHHWYALFFTILLICHLVWTPRTSRWYLPLAGLLIVTVGLTRHLTGAFVGMGTLSFLLLVEARESGDSLSFRDQWMGRLLCGAMLAMLSLYLWRSTDFVAFLMFGLWPVGLLAWQLSTVTVPNNRAIRILGGLCLGMVIGALPLLTYHMMNGSLLAMIDDNVIRPLDVLNWNLGKQVKYWMLPLGGIIQFGDSPGLFNLLNALYFLTVPLFAALNGFLLLLAVRRRTLHISLALPILAAFYGLISLFIQVPIYLHFSSILSIAGSLWVLSELKPGWGLSTSVMLVVLSGVSIAFQAGVPIRSSIMELISTEKPELFDSRGQLPKVDLLIRGESLEAYKKVVRIIEEETHQDDYLFAVPNNAELYFMTERRNPFRFNTIDHGVLNETEVQHVIQTLERLRPRIITFAPGAQRNTTHSLAIMEHVRAHSQLLSQDPFFEVYLYGEKSNRTQISARRLK